MNHDEHLEPEILNETDNFGVWRSKEGDDVIYHVELGGVSLHFNSEEWEEFVVLIKGAAQAA
ncbi:MAG: hypothetical protein D6706_12725 [Chloroflexi bacterium]|nr:MAG: hypothetical protein D6706_12725 [Chloroflexota bacterium]